MLGHLFTGLCLLGVSSLTAAHGRTKLGHISLEQTALSPVIGQWGPTLPSPDGGSGGLLLWLPLSRSHIPTAPGVRGNRQLLKFEMSEAPGGSSGIDAGPSSRGSEGSRESVVLSSSL